MSVRLVRSRTEDDLRLDGVLHLPPAEASRCDAWPADLVVLDGEDLAAEPVARIHLPQRVPDGFHGNWVPDSSVPPE